MSSDNAQGTLAAIGGTVALAGVGVLTGFTAITGLMAVSAGFVLLGSGLGMIVLRSYLRFVSGLAPE